jgi:hypothetical protein
MKLGLSIAVFILAAYFLDNQLYGGKFSTAASQITNRVITSFR